jgi:hypothetical protein
MRKLVLAFVALLVALVGFAAPVSAGPVTYSIVNYPAFQTDKYSGFVDSISGTIIADPTTGDIYSASFTITGQTGSYTVSNALVDPDYYVHITPTQIYLTSTDNPSNPYEYGYLGLRNRTDGGYPNVGVYWYLLGADDQLEWPTFHYSAYNGWYSPAKKSFVADFGTPLGGSPWVVATAVPDGGTTVALLGGVLIGIGVLRRKLRG